MIELILAHIARLGSHPRAELTFALVSRGVYRSESAYRNVLIVFRNGIPEYVAKWYRSARDSELALERESSIELFNSGVPVPEVLDLASVGGHQVLIERFIKGASLDHLLNRKFLTEEKALELSRNAMDTLYEKTLQVSSMDALRREIDDIFNPVIVQLNTGVSEAARFLIDVKGRLVEWFGSMGEVSTSLVHNDFTLSNLIHVDGVTHAFDFEFCRRSHFAFCDWLRLWKFSAGLEEEKMGDFEFPDSIKLVNATAERLRNALVLFDLVDFHIQCSVRPGYQRDGILKKLVADLLSRAQGTKARVRVMESPPAVAPGKYSELTVPEQLEHTRNELGWYTKKFRELLVSHYSLLEKERAAVESERGARRENVVVLGELRKIGMNCDKLALERNEKAAELAKSQAALELLNQQKLQLELEYNRVQGFSPDHLPRLLKFPVKALISTFARGPLEPLRIIEYRKQQKRLPLTVVDNTPQIEVVTLSYNSNRFIDEYFQAFTKIDYPKEKISLNVIDNNSADNSYQLIKEHFAENPSYPLKVKLYRSRKNLGFSGGNNFILKKLLRESKANYFFLLNIDTKIDPSCFARLVETMRSDPFTGMVEAVQRPREHPKWYDPTTGETGWCSGGGVLISRKALEEVGLFDDRFFLYCEDVDLSWRMWLHGWKCKINPTATYSHFTEGLDKERDRSVQRFYSVRNSFFMHYKYDTWAGIKRHKEHFEGVVNGQRDEASKKLLRKAYRSSRKYIPGLLLDRLRLSLFPKPHWIFFDGFNYEKRREFRDTETGRKILG